MSVWRAGGKEETTSLSLKWSTGTSVRSEKTKTKIKTIPETLHQNILQDEERFRCILWETDGVRIPPNPYGFVPDNVRSLQHQDNDTGEVTTFMSLSGDASCNGLYSSKEGQTLVLNPGEDRIPFSIIQWWFVLCNQDQAREKDIMGPFGIHECVLSGMTFDDLFQWAMMSYVPCPAG